MSISEGIAQVVHSELAETPPYISNYMKFPVKGLNRVPI